MKSQWPLTKKFKLRVPSSYKHYNSDHIPTLNAKALRGPQSQRCGAKQVMAIQDTSFPMNKGYYSPFTRKMGHVVCKVLAVPRDQLMGLSLIRRVLAGDCESNLKYRHTHTNAKSIYHKKKIDVKEFILHRKLTSHVGHRGIIFKKRDDKDKS